MLRVTGGTARGKKLKVPRGLNIRPTSARLRMALFNILPVEGKSFLDVFAGAGGVGLEALSRGAREATFVESHPLALKALRANLASIGFLDRARVMGMDAVEAYHRLLSEGCRFDIIFMDPPYARGLGEKVLPLFINLLARDGWLVLENRSREIPPEVPEAWLLDERYYGDSALRFYRRQDTTWT